jgi:hypothetical protein
MTNIIASIPPKRICSDSRRMISDPFKGVQKVGRDEANTVIEGQQY